MVNYPSSRMDSVFTALAHPARRRMIRRLARGPATVGELGRPLAMSKPAVTRHLKILERAGLLARERRGRVHECTLKPRPMRDAEAWLARNRAFWEASLDALVRYVEAPTPNQGESR